MYAGDTLVRTSRWRTKGDRRRDGQHAAVVATNDLPVALVHHPVMPVAEKGEVGRLIRTTVDPVLDMVARSPARRPLAPRPGAAPVAHIQRLARRSRDRPLGPPNIDDRGLRTEHDARDRS